MFFSSLPVAVVSVAHASWLKRLVTSDDIENLALFPEDEDLVPSRRWWTSPQEILSPNVFGPVAGDPLLYRAPIELGALLGKSRASAVYAIRDYPNWVIKYVAFCVDAEEDFDRFPDPVSRETHFLEIINSVDPSVGVTHLFTSAATELPAGSKGKVQMPADYCSDYQHRQVRYLVIERVGDTLMTMVERDGKVPIDTAATIALRIVFQLEKMHAMGIVHGDVHLGNVALRQTDTLGSWTLIDFGDARMGSEVQKFPLPHYPGTVYCHPYLSFWESMYFDSSFRDDIYRTILVMAMLVHGMDYFNQLAQLCVSPHTTPSLHLEYIGLKGKRNFFDTYINAAVAPGVIHKDEYKLVGVVRREKLRAVQRLTWDLLNVIRKPRAADSRPNYRKVKQLLFDLIAVVRGPLPSKP